MRRHLHMEETPIRGRDLLAICQNHLKVFVNESIVGNLRAHFRSYGNELGKYHKRNR